MGVWGIMSVLACVCNVYVMCMCVGGGGGRCGGGGIMSVLVCV